VNGEVLASSDLVSAYIDLKITYGTNSIEEKAVLIEKTIVLLNDTVGVTQKATYVVVDEISARAWGLWWKDPG
jgi:phenylpyruvate tautomerase PptA (4-oxalocrotonate tautomerase family)